MWVRIILFISLFISGVICYILRKFFSYRNRTNRVSLGGEAQQLLEMNSSASLAERENIKKAFVICYHQLHGFMILYAYKAKKGKHGQLPGGGVDPGETALQAACRELMEETGLVIEPTRLSFLRDVDKKRFFLLEIFDSDSELNLPGRTAPETGENFFLKLSLEHMGFAFVKDRARACEEIQLHSGGTPAIVLASCTIGR